MAGAQVLRAEMPTHIEVRRESLLIDLVHLSKYTLGNRSLECELLGLFRCQTSVYLDRLEKAASAKDWADAAHTLKGSARGVGAWAVGDQAEAAEAVSESEWDEALMLLRAAVDETVAHINMLLED